MLEPVNVERHDFVRLGVRERWVALVPPGSPLARLDAVSPAELSKHPVIMVRRPHVKSVLENWFGGYYKNLRVSFTSNLSTNAAHMVRRGLGCALVIEGSVMFWDRSFVRAVPLSPELLSTSVLAWKRGQPMSPAVEKFVDGARIHFKHDAAMK
ncbi:LysR family transcriptional regulator substrate-binding protein [Cloacibacillus sp. An23]|uniref:LysR family transcriptional regulator substrate-binding protein n=1 Tax=Cloacibacillus sp. An23 TaxID=1965591 RepID=UPI0019503F8C|nr:LysR family transcriptional regulator substrate-binding protein [Cloacibacillus sp. An23]